MKPMTCRECGNNLDSRAQFCVFCGAMVDPVPDVPPPARWPVILVTLLAGLFGLIPAAIAANRAQQRGLRGDRYWQAFGFALVAGFVGWGLVAGLAGLVIFQQGDRTFVAQPTAASRPATLNPETPRPPAPETTAATSHAPTMTQAAPAAPVTDPPRTNQASAPTTTRPASAWPAYVYGGPHDLCTTPTFPEKQLIKVGSGYQFATHSAESALVALGYDGVVVDGQLDSSSAAALTRFQRNNDLVADGTLGQQSWTALRARLLHYRKCP